MLEAIPNETFIFKCDRIWFSATVFVTKSSSKYNIYKYPNILINKFSNNKELESVQIKDKIKLIFKNHSCGREIKTFEYENQKQTLFKFKDDYVYYKNIRLFYLPATFNIAFCDLNLYRYRMDEEKYILESFQLFIPINGFIFDRYFFEKYNLDAHSCNYTSNGTNFAVWSDKILAVDMTYKRNFEYEIIDVKMTKHNILCKLKNDTQFEFLILNLLLEDVFKGEIDIFIESLYYGFVIKVENKYIHIRSNEIVHLEICFNRIEAIMTNKVSNITFSVYNNEYRFDTWNSSEIIMASEKIYKKLGSTTKEYKKLFDTRIFRNDAAIGNIIHLSLYQNRLLIGTHEKIIFIYNKYIFVVENDTDNMLFCDAQDFSLIFYNDGKSHKKKLYDLIFVAATETFITMDSYVCIQSELESFLLRLCKADKYSEFKSIIKNPTFCTEYTLCSVYRKCDINERNKLLSILPEKYFQCIKDSKAQSLIFLCCEIDLYYFVSSCFRQNNIRSIQEIYNYYDKNNYFAEKQEILSILWKKGDVRTLSSLIELKLSESLKKAQKLL